MSDPSTFLHFLKTSRSDIRISRMPWKVSIGNKSDCKDWSLKSRAVSLHINLLSIETSAKISEGVDKIPFLLTGLLDSQADYLSPTTGALADSAVHVNQPTNQTTPGCCLYPWLTLISYGQTDDWSVPNMGYGQQLQ